MKNLKTLFFCSVISCSLLLACDKNDDNNDNIITKTGLPMSGSQEVPVRTTPATATFDVLYNKSNKVLNYTLNWTGLTGNPTGSHIHGSSPGGVNAGIKHDFFTPFPKTVSGTYSGSVTIDGVAIKEDSLLSGFYYFNIHTPTFPGGEIRGQIEF